MKKRIFIISTFIVILLFGIFYIYAKNDKHYKKVSYSDNIILSIDDGNQTLDSVPEKGPYEVRVYCSNADGVWDYNKWELVVKNVQGPVYCDLSFIAVSTSQNFASYIISLAGTSQGDGMLVNENGYRYEGADPANYVWFNDELWRIIGVFGSNRHGLSDGNLVKIIRAEPIGSYSWNGTSTYENDWPNSNLYRMLNGCYYNALTGTDTTTISGSSASCLDYCIIHYNVNTNISGARTGHCDFRTVGIKNDGNIFGYRDMIRRSNWYLGGPGASGYTSYYVDDIYSYENNSSAITSGRSTLTAGLVGLMYMSDFGYAADSDMCTRGYYNMTSTTPNYGSEICANNNWLYKYTYGWTITPNSGTAGTNVMGINYNGYIGSFSSYASMSVSPVVYLKTTTYRVAGDGTVTNPYILDYEYFNSFNYSSSVQTLNVPKDGYYKLQVYGGQGGSYNSSTPGGSGGYAEGVVHLTTSDTLYIHTGGKGSYGTSQTMTTKEGGGANGGGNASYRGGGGGGATDIRINSDSLYARVIVAGGGGGSYHYNSSYKAAGGNGGGTSGSAGAYYNSSYTAFTGKGGTATAGGAGGTGSSTAYSGSAGTFGNGGASGRAYSTSYYSGGGGGGGWYGGGGAANYSGSSRTRAAGGGGGSSYVYTSSTASNYPSGCLLNSNYYLSYTTITAGVQTGNGYAKITYCGKQLSDCA